MMYTRASWAGLAALVAATAVGLWVLHQRGALSTSCQLQQAAPQPTPWWSNKALDQQVRGGMSIYASLVHKYLGLFFEKYRASLVQGQFSQADLASMQKSARKVERYLLEFEFRRCNDLLASARHATMTKDLLRALEAYLQDAARRNKLHYVARVL